VNDPHKPLLVDLNFRTALLESVDWDETQSDSLLLYLQDALVKKDILPEEILFYVKNNHGESAHDLIKKMFTDIYIENGLYFKTEDKYEH